MRSVIVSHPSFGNAPEWGRTAHIDDDGTIFLPAVLAGPETLVMMESLWDGTPLVKDSGHVYLPLEWLASNYPEIEPTLRNAEKNLREYIAADS